MPPPAPSVKKLYKFYGQNIIFKFALNKKRTPPQGLSAYQPQINSNEKRALAARVRYVPAGLAAHNSHCLKERIVNALLN